MSSAESMEYSRGIIGKNIAQKAKKGQSLPTAISGLTLYNRICVSQPATALYQPSICLVVQGAKRVMLGEDSYVYDANHYLITSVDIPTMVQIVQASEAKPCLGIVLQLDLREISQLMVDGNLPHPRAHQPERGMALGRVDLPLLDAFGRLVSLLDCPGDIPILAPVIKREIFYRLLTGEQGARLRQIASMGSQGHQISQAIDWLKNNYSKPLRVDDLAHRVYMGTSTFNHHFRAMTAKSPLQYQKWLRLNEARRLMLAERCDAASAAFQVGYESQSQFSREYGRLFGEPPLRDMAKLRQEANALAV